MTNSRIELRNQSANIVNSVSKDRLLKEFSISRISDLTGLDVIGIPVYSAVRVLSKTVTIHSGKHVDKHLCRAGAICEAIEFEVGDNPKGPFKVAAADQIPVEDRIEIEDCLPARSSIVNEWTPLAWELATNIQNGTEKLIPSDLIWMTTRISQQPLMYLQTGTNGLASGASLEDAILSGLYEVIERDGWTLNQYLLDNYGILPNRTPLSGLPPKVEAIVRTIEDKQIKLHLFDYTTDYGVPIFSAFLLDLSGHCSGTFSGYGSHLNAQDAALRAILEAVQARACYISGARDDLLRRQFLLMKRIDQKKLHDIFSELPTASSLNEYRTVEFEDVKSELNYLLKLVKSRGVSDVYVKKLGSYLDGSIHVVRIFSPQCEPHNFDHYAPTLRCFSYVKRKTDQLSNGIGKTAPAVEEE